MLRETMLRSREGAFQAEQIDDVKAPRKNKLWRWAKSPMTET